MKKLYLGIGALVLLSPLGLLAKGSAWGEWTAADLKKMVGYAPRGLAALETLWRAPLAGYAFPGAINGPAAAFGYVVSGAIGVALIFGVFILLGRFLVKDEDDDNT